MTQVQVSIFPSRRLSVQSVRGNFHLHRPYLAIGLQRTMSEIQYNCGFQGTSVLPATKYFYIDTLLYNMLIKLSVVLVSSRSVLLLILLLCTNSNFSATSV